MKGTQRLQQVAVIEMSATSPKGWTADDVVNEIATLMELSGQDDKPEFINGDAVALWRTV